MNENEKTLVKCLSDIPNVIIVKSVDGNKTSNMLMMLGATNNGHSYLNEKDKKK